MKIDGLDELLKRFGKEIPNDVATGMRKAVNASVLMVQASAWRSIKRISAGKVVTRRGKRVVVSKPGDAPNNDTGNLWSMILVSTAVGNRSKGYSATVRSSAKYGKLLEEKLNRPYMRPALKANKTKIKKLITKALKGAL